MKRLFAAMPVWLAAVSCTVAPPNLNPSYGDPAYRAYAVFSPDAQWLAAGGWDYLIHVWNPGNGLKEGDYQLDQLAMPQHVTAMQAGTYDAGYTLEPAVTLMENQGSASAIESGVIATYVLGKDDADAWVAGTALTGEFLADRPDVAKRFAQAWARALADIAKDDTVRKHLVKNTFTPEPVAPTVPLVNFVMTGDLSDDEKAEFQQFIDFVADNGVLSEKVDVTKYLKTF